MAIMLVIIKDSIVQSQPTLPRIDGLTLERKPNRYVRVSFMHDQVQTTVSFSMICKTSLHHQL